MNKIFKILIILLFLPGSVWAKQLSPLSGNFDVSLQDAKALMAYEVESVWTFTQQGKERLQYLKDTYGASCLHIQRSLYRCKRFLNTQKIPTKVVQRIQSEWTYSDMTFFPVAGSELLYEGETVKEYLVEQLGEINKNSGQERFQKWRYFYGERDLEKIQAGEKSPSPYSFVRKQNEINLIFSEGMTLDRFRFQVWTISLPFIKQQAF